LNRLLPLVRGLCKRTPPGAHFDLVEPSLWILYNNPGFKGPLTRFPPFTYRCPRPKPVLCVYPQQVIPSATWRDPEATPESILHSLASPPFVFFFFLFLYFFFLILLQKLFLFPPFFLHLPTDPSLHTSAGLGVKKLLSHYSSLFPFFRSPGSSHTRLGPALVEVLKRELTVRPFFHNPHL